MTQGTEHRRKVVGAIKRKLDGTQGDGMNASKLINEAKQSINVGKKGGKGRNRNYLPRTGRPTPILGAYLSRNKSRNNAHIAGSGAMEDAGHLINEGWEMFEKHLHSTSTDHPALYNKSRATDFMYDSDLSFAILKKEPVDPQKTFRCRPWQITSGIMKNRLISVVDGKETYVPYQDQDIVEVEKNVETCDVSDSLKKVRDFQGVLMVDFRFMSVILREPNANGMALLDGFIKNNVADNEIRNKIYSGITRIVDDKEGFTFREPDVRSYRTKNHTTSVCILNGFMKPKTSNAEYMVEIYRKMIVVKVENTKDKLPYYISVCEEFFMQIRMSDKKSSTYAENGFFMTGRPGGGFVDRRIVAPVDSEFHYLGNNAFTMTMLYENQNPLNKSEEIVRNAGVVVKHIQGVKSKQTKRWNHTDMFFDLIFKKGLPTKTYDLFAERVKNVPEKHKKYEVMKASFLGDKYARNQTAVVNEESPTVNIWLSSKSFSVFSLSPANMPNLNYVYIRLWDAGDRNVALLKPTINPPAIVQFPSNGPFGGNELEDMIGGSRVRIPGSGPRSSMDHHLNETQNGSTFFESSLPPELELELALL